MSYLVRMLLIPCTWYDYSCISYSKMCVSGYTHLKAPGRRELG